MASTKTNKQGKPKATPTKKANQVKGLPDSYYRGQDKKTKPKKDKDGYIIPG